MQRERTLSRDVTATQIPAGTKQKLATGTIVFIHQTLGGSYTVQTDFGLFRIDNQDADAIGEQVLDAAVKSSTLTDGAPDRRRSGTSSAKFSTLRYRSTSSTSASFTRWTWGSCPTTAASKSMLR